MGATVVAIHQPNFFPWLGYFFKIFIADRFVLLDDVEYTSSGLTKRVHIRQAWDRDDKGYLSVPIKKPSNHTMIKDIRIKEGMNWAEVHLGKLRSVYRKAPFWTLYENPVRLIYDPCRDMTSLAEVNTYIIRSMMDLLQIETKIYCSSQIKVDGQKEDYVINLTKALDGGVYLSGTGAKKYQNEEHFRSNGLGLVYNHFFDYTSSHPYPQPQGQTYLPGLSVLDALFNVGPERIVEMFNEAARYLSMKTNES